ncbi:MAG: SpoIID/LytB domain-containing protein [Bacteroidota bacterium]
MLPARAPGWTAGPLVFALTLAALLGSGCASTRPREAPPAPAPAPREEPVPPAPPPRRTPVRTSPPFGGPAAPGPVSDAWRTATTVRIGLKVGVPQMLVGGSTAWKLVTPDGNELASLDAGAVLRIRRAGGSIDVLHRGGGSAIASTDPDDTLLLVPEGSGYSGWSGRWYRGTFRIYGSASGGLTIVNVVPLEDYLRGVLPEEIGHPPDTDYQAVKAQAVAARSYTLSYLGRRADLGFDLWATVEDQVYGGTLRESSQTNRAVQETRGEVLLSDNAPIRAVYSSACGGRTSNVEDVWPWPWTSYLRSVRDADEGTLNGWCSLSANYRWREEWSVDEFIDTLRKYAPAEGASAAALDGQLLDVRVESRSRCGRVWELVIETTDGVCILHGDRIRWSLRRPGGDAILRSSFFKIGIVRATDGAPMEVVATGAGNGHGIGMCQWGAMGMARAGKSYREILRHYYKGTQLAHL